MSTNAPFVVSIQVAAPIWRVYQNWRRLERFPSFFPAVREAKWLSASQLLWREEVEDVVVESTFHVTFNAQESSLAWRSLSGPVSAGSAQCEPQPGGGTRLTLTVQLPPAAPAAMRAFMEGRHQEYLEAFKTLVEAKFSAPRPSFSPQTSTPSHATSAAVPANRHG